MDTHARVSLRVAKIRFFCILQYYAGEILMIVE